MVHEMGFDAVDLQITSAFPTALRDDVRRAASVLPKPFLSSMGAFRTVVENEVVIVPYRVYYDTKLIDADRLTPAQQIIISCLLTRHHNGYVREEHLRRIISSNHAWIPPFVIQLIGEYVMEILQVIDEKLAVLNAEAYSGFLKDNPTFWSTTKRRVVSYWDCYYRRAWPRWEDYVGFRLVEYLDSFLLTSD
jgi:hypothetical protein